MNKKNLLSAFLFFQVSMAIASTNIPGGNVSGTWTAAGSPYLVQGNITLQSGSTLTIEPGVVVNFQGNYSFTVNGFLQSVGTASDSIHFTAGTNWGGITFSNAPDSSHLEYCTISGSITAWGGIGCFSSNPVIKHSTIRNNNGTFGGGIFLSTSNPSITYCTINNNQSYDKGGGIRSESSNPYISYCNITGNYGNSGGGINISGGITSLNNCIISNNKAYSGGGIAFTGGVVTITECYIAADTVNTQGGGIYVSLGGYLAITNSTIRHCKAPSGGGLYIAQVDSMLIQGCTVDSNVVDYYGGGGAVYINQAGKVSMTGTTFDDNYCGSTQGGVIYSVNCSNLVVDHCDVVHNHGFLFEGGIILNGNTVITLKNCIFRGQNGPDISFASYTSASVLYSDFGSTPPFASPPAGLGTLVQTNVNGDSCDVFYNIYLDPRFVDFTGSDYHLTGTSPCIDAGDPGSAYDPDCTVPDMGRYYFDQGPCTRTWSGAVDDDWANSLNWIPNGVPGNGDNVIIPGSATNMPKVKNNGQECNDILMEDGAQLTINPGMILTINGEVTLEGF